MNLYRPKGLGVARQILDRATKILVYYDPDVDGLIAGHFVVSLLKKYGKAYQYYINENRQHGMTLSDTQLEKLQGYTIIAVDFSISAEVLNKMLSYGISVVNIDHHAIAHNELVHMQKLNSEAVVINNQYGFEPDEWRFLSGAGVVYYVLSALFPDWGTEQNLALVGVTLLSDIRAIENQNAYEILKVTYNWEDEYSKYLIKLAKFGSTNYQFGTQKYLDRSFIDYSLSPRFNALFRLNLGDIAVKLIEQEPMDLRKLNAMLQLPLDNTIVNLTYIVKHSKAVIAKVMENLQVLRYSGLCVCYLNELDFPCIDYNISNFVGLVAGRIREQEGLTTMVLVHNDNGIVRGSVRGLYDGVDYLNICRKHGITCEGHLNAFGVLHCGNISFNNLSDAIQEAECGRTADLGRIIEVNNLSYQVETDNVTPEYNSFVRTSHMRYYKYIGNNYCETVHSEKYVCYDIDGVTVKGYSPDLNPTNALILPVLNNGYVEHILEKVVI